MCAYLVLQNLDPRYDKYWHTVAIIPVYNFVQTQHVCVNHCSCQCENSVESDRNFFTIQSLATTRDCSSVPSHMRAKQEFSIHYFGWISGKTSYLLEQYNNGTNYLERWWMLQHWRHSRESWTTRRPTVIRSNPRDGVSSRRFVPAPRQPSMPSYQM